MLKYFNAHIGSRENQLRIQITPLSWQLGFCIRIAKKGQNPKLALGIGPIAVALDFGHPHFEKTYSSDLTDR